jgi:hypothetical protein
MMASRERSRSRSRSRSRGRAVGGAGEGAAGGAGAGPKMSEARARALAERAKLVQYYRTQVAAWDNGTPASIAGPLTRAQQKMDELRQNYKTSVAPLVKDLKGVKEHLLAAMERAHIACIELPAAMVEGGGAPALAAPAAPKKPAKAGAAPPKEPVLYLRRALRSCPGATLNAALIHRVLALDVPGFNALAKEIQDERDAALAQWRAAYLQTRLEDLSKTAKKAGAGAGAASGKRARSSYVSKAKQAAALAEAAATLTDTVDADRLEKAGWEGRRATVDLGGGGSGGPGSSAPGAALSSLEALRAAAAVAVPAADDPVNGDEGAPPLGRPLTVREMFQEVVRLHLKRLHRPTKPVVTLTKAKPRGLAPDAIVPADAVASAPAGSAVKAMASAAGRWSTLKAQVGSAQAANRTARLPLRLTQQACHERLLPLLAAQDPTYVFRAAVAEGAGKAQVSIYLRPKEVLDARLTVGTVCDMVREAASARLPRWADVPFDPATHTAQVLGKPAVGVLQDVSKALADFYAAHATVQQVVRYKRVVPGADAADGAESYDSSDFEDSDDDGA